MSLNSDIYAIIFILLIFPVFCTVTEMLISLRTASHTHLARQKYRIMKGLAILCISDSR